MSNFYIDKIIANGSGKEDAIIVFGKGLNIIQGYSDTGKTCVVKCINFIFGSSDKPFDSTTGYSSVTMVLVTPGGAVTLKRSLGKNQIEVASENRSIENGVYDIAYKRKQKNPVINAVWLKLLGIDGEPMIVKNMNFEKSHLTWKTLTRLVYIHEDVIAQSISIIEPAQYVEKTLFLSALLYLVCGRDFSETDAQTKKEIKTARRKAIEEYVNKKLSGIAQRRRELTEQLLLFDGVDVDEAIDTIASDLEKKDAEITQAVNNSKDLLSKIMTAEGKSTECDVLISRYQALRSQYVADIKRLTFIVNGEAGMQEVPKTTKCPFCDGKIPAHNRESYIGAARAELARIMLQLDGLSGTEKDVQMEKLGIETEIATLRAQRADVEVLIEEHLKPKAEDLEQSLANYRAYTRLKNEMDMIDSFSDSWTSDLRDLSADDNNALEYRPKEYFDDAFRAAMDKYAKEILGECHYENLSSARFNMSDFDIEVNGGKKATNHGKGYRAFLNTVVALMFRRYLANDAKFNTGLLIIDTPLLGLDQGVDDAAPESMRTALFKFFMDNQSDGQLIVVENLDHIPKLDYTASGATVTTFTKGRFPGRYGFLHGVY